MLLRRTCKFNSGSACIGLLDSILSKQHTSDYLHYQDISTETFVSYLYGFTDCKYINNSNQWFNLWLLECIWIAKPGRQLICNVNLSCFFLVA